MKKFRKKKKTVLNKSFVLFLKPTFSWQKDILLQVV